MKLILPVILFFNQDLIFLCLVTKIQFQEPRLFFGFVFLCEMIGRKLLVNLNKCSTCYQNCE